MAFIVLVYVPVQAKEPDWLIKLRKLEVFLSTKSDVEKIFDNPKITRSYLKNSLIKFCAWQDAKN